MNGMIVNLSQLLANVVRPVLHGQPSGLSSAEVGAMLGAVLLTMPELDDGTRSAEFFAGQAYHHTHVLLAIHAAMIGTKIIGLDDIPHPTSMTPVQTSLLLIDVAKTEIRRKPPTELEATLELVVQRAVAGRPALIVLDPFNAFTYQAADDNPKHVIQRFWGALGVQVRIVPGQLAETL